MCKCMHMYEYAFYVLRYTCTYVSLIYRRIYYLHMYLIHTLNWQNFTIIMNKRTVLKILQNFEFLLSKLICTLIIM